MAFENQDERNSFGDKIKDIAKMFAQRMIKNVAKKLIKKLLKVALKVLLKAMLKAAAWLLATIGIPGIIIILCVVLFAGAAAFIGKTFGWLDDNSPVTANELKARYEQAAASTADDASFRVPMWLIQDIDNIRIVKTDKKPWDVNPEQISSALKTTVSEETREEKTTSWTAYDNSSTEPSVSTESQKVIHQVHTWNRLITYTYTSVTDEDVTRETSNTTGSDDYGGTRSSTISRITTRWVLDREESVDYGAGGKVTTFFYKPLSDVYSTSRSTPLKGKKDKTDTTGTETVSSFNSVWSANGQSSEQTATYEGTKEVKTYKYQNAQTSSPESSSEIQLDSFNGEGTSSSESHRQTTRWVVSEIKEEPNFEMFDHLLQELQFSRSDFSYLEDVIAEDDPSLSTIVGYSDEHLIPDDLVPTTNNLDTYVGGRLPDAPNIPASAEWVFPTNPNGIIGDGFGGRFDPSKHKYAFHKGQDISRAVTDKEKGMDYINYAVDDGEVVAAGDANDGYGYKVMIDHGGGIETLYAHMKAGSLQVHVGDKVKKGQALGIMGATGLVTGIHLHFEVHVNGEPVNPIGYLRR